MSVYFDTKSGLVLGDSSLVPKLLSSPPSQSELKQALSALILSASGWRKVFVASGDEEDSSELISSTDMIIAWHMARVFVDALPQLTKKLPANTTVLVAMDSRPTGTVLADLMIRALIGHGINVHYIFIASAPEAMAHAKLDAAIDAFIYISASHNPIGHNGVKFGLKSGGVLNAAQVNPLIESFKSALSRSDASSAAYNSIHSIEPEKLNAVFEKVAAHKKLALQHYSELCQIVVSNSTSKDIAKARMAQLAEASHMTNLGIVADMNGSARCLTIDSKFFTNSGLQFWPVNNVARQIAHRIVPEGISLDTCRQELEKLRKIKSGFVLGYMPDNDGDRGNIVYFDEAKNKAVILEAQEVFALSCLAELAYLVYCGDVVYSKDGLPNRKIAIAVNDATSMRIEEIAQVFGAEVFRSEVGEANVVQLAQKLRDEGYLVRILGEGSNGGNITHPSAVRDPLSTVMSLVKLLVLRDDESKKGLFGIWSGLQNRHYSKAYNLDDIILSLPQWTTTSAYEDCAIMKIASEHAQLKASYEAIFQKQFALKESQLKEKFGIAGYQVINYEGINTIYGMGSDKRTGKERGGFKVLFSNENGKPIVYLWMRGSGTEPVFRILVDLKGNNKSGETYLLDWHRAMIVEAESLASSIKA